MTFGTTASFRAKLWAFVLGTSGRLLSWILVALILTAFAQWEKTRTKPAHGATEITGAERPAKLGRLTDDPPDNGDFTERSNKQNFAIANDIQEAKIDYEIYLNPDCSPRADFFLQLREKPLHGSVRIDLDKNYAAYDNDNQRYKCNLTATQSPSIFYRRNKGFVGKDSFIVEVFEPSGYVRTTHYLIDAR